MFDISYRDQAVSKLGIDALNAVTTIELAEGLQVVSGAVQVMVFDDQIGQLGGLSTQACGQYLLAPAVEGRVSTEQLEALGFEAKFRSDGSYYWFRRGHDQFDGFFDAIAGMTGRTV